MTWTRLPDDFTDRPELLRVSRSARLLHVEALVYCNRHLTDGLLPSGALRRITDAENILDLANELRQVRLWQWVDPDGFQVDWSDQESAERVRERRADNQRRQELYVRRRKLHAAGDHSLCAPRYCPNALLAAQTTSSATASLTPPRPDPTRPDPKGGKGKGRGGGPAVAGRPAPETKDSHVFRPDGQGRSCTFTWRPPGQPRHPGYRCEETARHPSHRKVSR